MNSPEKKLENMGIVLPLPSASAGSYVPVVKTGNLMFTAGSGPACWPDGTLPTGKVGKDLSVEEGYEIARLVGINLLARLKQELGDLDRVVQIVKLLCMVNATHDFTEHPSVANGASDLMLEVFGEKGRHGRSAVGMGSLPFNIPVEIEMVVEIKE